MIFETHAHYDDEKFDEDRAELLSSMQENGIGRIINVSANLESLENTRKLMEAYPWKSLRFSAFRSRAVCRDRPRSRTPSGTRILFSCAKSDRFPAENRPALQSHTTVLSARPRSHL